jgi:hypothetical protein
LSTAEDVREDVVVLCHSLLLKRSACGRIGLCWWLRSADFLWRPLATACTGVTGEGSTSPTTSDAVCAVGLSNCRPCVCVRLSLLVPPAASQRPTVLMAYSSCLC